MMENRKPKRTTNQQKKELIDYADIMRQRRDEFEKSVAEHRQRRQYQCSHNHFSVLVGELPSYSLKDSNNKQCPVCQFQLVDLVVKNTQEQEHHTNQNNNLFEEACLVCGWKCSSS